jgi:hypothetical protein
MLQFLTMPRLVGQQYVGPVANLPELRQIGNLPHIGVRHVVASPCGSIP